MVGALKRTRTASIGWHVIGAATVWTLAGCQPDLRLVAIRGCGLDTELEGLRVTVRGDFPQRAVELDEPGTLAPLPAGATGITVEGYVDPNDIDAVGRTPRLRSRGDLSVYFAPQESLCAVVSQLRSYTVGDGAVGPNGDIVLVGGRRADGTLVDDIVHLRDDDDEIVVTGAVPIPAIGQAVVAVGGREFLVIGGAGPEQAISSMFRIDLAAAVDVVGAPVLVDVDGQPRSRAYHAAARLPDGEVLVIGGCSETAPSTAECVPASVLSSAFFVDAETPDLTARPGPALLQARYDAELLVASDGVAFAVGGRSNDATPVHSIEILEPESSTWQEVDAGLQSLLGEAAIAGATLLDGGIVVVVATDGKVAWFSEGMQACSVGPEHDPTAPCVKDALLEPAARRSVVGLWGERVLVDNFVLPVALVGADFSDGSGERAPHRLLNLVAITPGAPRAAAEQLLLADGTVLVAGGDDPSVGAFLLRYRPPLDGPDERTPAIAGPERDSFVIHHRDVMLADDEVGRWLRLIGNGSLHPFPPVRAHARGFRSRRFRFDVKLRAMGGGRPHLVFEHGARSGVSIRLDQKLSGWRRVAGQPPRPIACHGGGVPLDGQLPLRIDVSPQTIELRVGGEMVGSCAGIGDVPVAVGIGIADFGVVEARDFSLARK